MSFQKCPFLIFSVEAKNISCYVCPHGDGSHKCDPLELWGNQTLCPEGVSTCYKSWSGTNCAISAMIKSGGKSRYSLISNSHLLQGVQKFLFIDATP